MYVTPGRLATMGLGVDLDSLDDVEIRSALDRAAATIHAYCNVPLQPSMHDFRGGTITGEIHEWKADQYERNMTPFRFWPWHQPVQTVTDFRIYSTPTIYTQIDPSEVFVNNSAGFVEASSLKLTQYGVFGAGVITALIGMWNPQAYTSYTYGHRFPVVAETLEPTDAETFRAQNQWWDSAVVPEIKVDGVVATSGFTIDYNEGLVLFSSAQPADTLVTASYTHTLPWQIAQAEGLLAADDLSESALRAKGMGGIDSLQVGEITLRRAALGRRASSTVVADLPTAARILLSNFIFQTVR